MRWLAAWWRRRQRTVDLCVLWPTVRCQVVKIGGDIDYARAVFMLHTDVDSAWSDLTHDERCRIVDTLH